jgi:hypothetical protein
MSIFKTMLIVERMSHLGHCRCTSLSISVQGCDTVHSYLLNHDVPLSVTIDTHPFQLVRKGAPQSSSTY